VVGLAGCATPSNLAGTGEPAVTETATEVVTEAVDPAVAEENWTADTVREAAQDPEDLVVTDIEVGAHEGFDRVVYHLSGQGTPGYSVEYVDQAVQDGSGFVHDTGDDKVLAVIFDNMVMPFDIEATEFSDSPVVGEGDIVHQVIYDSWFEGQVRTFITVNPNVTDPMFSVSLLDNPTRLVVDIAAADTVGR